MMTAAEAIAFLQTVPPDTLLESERKKFASSTFTPENTMRHRENQWTS